MARNIHKNEGGNWLSGGEMLDQSGGYDAQEGAIDPSDAWWKGYDIYDQLHWGSVLGFGDEDYERLKAWDRMGGMMKIEPMYWKQTYYRSEVAYIAEKQIYPQIQRVPIQNVKITPHQISFDFFDTTEGKIGVSNATEKHMVVECDVLVSDLIYFYWNHAGTAMQGQLFGLDGSGGGGGLTGLRFINQLEKNVDRMLDSLEKGECYKGDIHKHGEGMWNYMWSEIGLPWDGFNRVVQDFQETQEFLDFRNTIFQQFNGWVCQFTSEIFGVFNGVITEQSYEIEDGSMDAKWHLKIQEAIFTEDYSEEGKKNTTSEGSSDGSGE